jgi:hypothetical protein
VSSNYNVKRSPYVSGAKGFRALFLDRMGRNLRELLDDPPLSAPGGNGSLEANAVGSLLIVSDDENEALQEEYALRESRGMGAGAIERLLKRVVAMKLDDGHPEDLRHKCGTAESIRIRESGREDRLERNLAGNSFRELLESYVRGFFPVDGVLPVGYEHETFPFLLFNSYNLPELRGKLFAEKQMLASNELNVLNLILSRDDKIES